MVYVLGGVGLVGAILALAGCPTVTLFQGVSVGILMLFLSSFVSRR
jgi:hypothetical protein